MTELLLDAREVRVQFGGLTAVNDVDLCIVLGGDGTILTALRRYTGTGRCGWCWWYHEVFRLCLVGEVPVRYVSG